jgi:two-component system cell cycle response regulator
VKILIAEDDPVSRRLLEAKLTRWGYEVIVTRDGNEAWQALQAVDAPRLAVLDWMMPGMDGADLCREIRKGLKEPYTYIILLTTLRGEEDIVAGMEAGADDYITKPFRASELKVRLRAGRRIIELQNELISARETLRKKATHDSLTGLWNHEEIMQILARELERAGRENSSVAIIMADLDYFKKINDTYGHLAGDAVLRLTAQRMVSLIRPYDAIGRYGGEEFLAVIPGCSMKSAASLAERLRKRIGGESMDTPEGMIEVTISFGIAISNNGKPADATSLVHAADMALYRAKNKGRNRVEVASEEEADKIIDNR